MPNRLDLDAEQIAAAYHRNVSVNQMAKDQKVSRSCIVRVLRAVGLTPRGVEEQAKLQLAQLTDEQRRERVRMAHHANRGSKRSDKTLWWRAKLREQQGRLTARQESWLQILTPLHDKWEPRIAIDRYNISLGLRELRIGVEIYEQSYTREGLPAIHARKRSYIESLGWLFYNVGDSVKSEERLPGFLETLRAAIAERSRAAAVEG